jgi:hypothetical protein
MAGEKPQGLFSTWTMKKDFIRAMFCPLAEEITLW